MPELECSPSPDDALKRLMKGNERYIRDQLDHPNRTSESRRATNFVQTPFAVILGCSDSRVSPEIIFDEGIGDLFVVRVAGNVIGPLEMESIEYAILVLKASLILVLGHENCGAVKAVVDGAAGGFPALAKAIGPSVDLAKTEDPEHLLPTAVKDNALQMKKVLESSKSIGKLIKEKKIGVQAAYYHLKSGQVQLL